MEQAFKAHIYEAFPELMQESFLLACSGGLDSTVLTHLFAKLGASFELAHCNFGLRGKESQADLEFVEQLGKDLSLMVHVKNFDTVGYVTEHKVSVQMAAREQRYRWFAQLQQAGAASYIVTAHHADDVLETFLINLSRGSGLEGLCGIPARSNAIRRPLLPFSRAQLEDFARREGLVWREDASNASLTYLRNRFRHLAIPAIKEAEPDFLDQFGRSVSYLDGSRRLVSVYMESLKRDLVRERNGDLWFPLADLKALKPLDAHLHEMFKGYGFTDWRAIADLLEGESGREVWSGTGCRLLRARDALILRVNGSGEAGMFSWEGSNIPPDLPLRLRIESVETLGPPDPRVLYVDKETLNEGWSLRKWRKGDYFYPLGMRGRKLVSKFFRDSKLDRFAREDQWLLCSGPDIAWVVGQRADDRFKVTAATHEILKITWLG